MSVEKEDVGTELWVRPSTGEELVGREGLDEYTVVLETRCGIADDSQPVEKYDGSLGVSVAFVQQHQAAVAQVQWNADLADKFDQPGGVAGVRWGSGAMITDDLFLTCGHLFSRTPEGWALPKRNGVVIPSKEIALNMHLNFNYQAGPDGVPRPESSYSIVELIEFELDGLDMAICRIDGKPGEKFGKIVVSKTDAAPGEMVCIIGHPDGRPKRIEAGPVTSLSDGAVRYNDIDTLGGNSGSAILRAHDGKVIGVHTNGGCNAEGTGSNYGVTISALLAVSPTLQALAK